MATWTRDAALALIVLVIGLVGTHYAARIQDAGDRLGPLTYALVTLAALALVARSARPLGVLAVTGAATGLYLLLGYPYGPIQISVVVAVFTVGRLLPLATAATACAAVTVALLLHGVVGASDATPTGVLPFSVWTIVPFAVGVVARVTAEANARQRTGRVLEERLRLAQEVHDVVGHGLSAINMRAEIALHLLPRRPEQAEEALTAISRTSREALDELRATLAALRSPMPGLARLDDLVERLSGTGVPVTVDFTGTRGSLPPAVDLAAYRVIQESLTNVLRHAGAASATVTIDHQPSCLEVTVADDGPGAFTSDGNGINGMRERVTALGGTFEAGPGAGGGFLVRGSFPL